MSFQDGLSDHEGSGVYREIHDLTAYLLRQYSGSGKTFYIGYTEGDWHLRWDYDRQRPLRHEAVEGMVGWLNARQEAIDDAKRETPHLGVHVFGYTEVDLVQRGLRGQPCAVNEVLPKVDVDYVSYSVWDATNEPGVGRSAPQEALRRPEPHREQPAAETASSGRDAGLDPGVRLSLYVLQRGRSGQEHPLGAPGGPGVGVSLRSVLGALQQRGGG